MMLASRLASHAWPPLRVVLYSAMAVMATELPEALLCGETSNVSTVLRRRSGVWRTTS